MYDDDENRFSLRKVNKINIDYRLGKFYLTDDDKLKNRASFAMMVMV